MRSFAAWLLAASLALCLAMAKPPASNDQPTAQNPPSSSSKQNQPSSNQPPNNPPPANQTPTNQPPANQPPASPPAAPESASQPPATQPATKPVKHIHGPPIQVPSAEDQAKAINIIREIFQEEYAKSGRQDRQALGAKLLSEAEETDDDPTGRYVMLLEARRLAMQTGDIDTAQAVLEDVIVGYYVDADAWRISTLQELGRAELSSDDLRLLAEAWANLAVDAVADERYATAGQAISQAQVVAGRVHDAVFTADMTANLKHAHEVITQYARVKVALDALQSEPEDPENSSLAGWFYCFARGEWARGLPYLARGSDAGLRRLAALDLANPQEPAAQMEVGDGWWDFGASQNPMVKSAAQERAGFWYKAALPNLHGLEATKVLERLETLSRGRVIDLIAKLNPARDFPNHSTWTLQRGQLDCDAANAIVQFPYVPPEEYDLRAEFKLHGPKPGVELILAKGGTQFAWIMGSAGNTQWLIERAGGASGKNPTIVHRALQADHRYTCVIQVRSGGVQVFIDGEQVCQNSGDYKNLAMPDPPLPNHHLLGAVTSPCQTVFYKIELIEIKGTGKPTR